MKHIIITAVLFLSASISFAQNIFPSSGNAGIGTTSPSSRLDVTLPTLASFNSGIRISSPAIFQYGSSISSLFQVRQMHWNSSAYLNVFGIKTNGNIGIGVEMNDPLLSSRKMVITDGNINRVDLNVRGFALIDGQNASLLFGATGGEALGQWGIEYNAFGTVAGLNFWKPAGSNNAGNYFMFLNDDGQVSIGLDPNHPNTFKGDYSLYVGTGIMTEKIKVAIHSSDDWADYVFNDDYQLMPLEEVELFVEENNHLPGVPSAQEVAEEGIDVAEMDAKLLEKIEELTLYMIELKKQNEQLQADVNALKTVKQ